MFFARRSREEPSSASSAVDPSCPKRPQHPPSSPRSPFERPSAMNSSARKTKMDGIELEIVWSNLISIVSEQAKALQRIAFSPIVREAGDLANALFDRRGRMVAQAITGTPGHINSLAAAGRHFIEAFPTQTIESGDVLITNDPWLSAGHFFDISIMVPAFHKDRLIGFFGSTIHHTDIGGYGVGAGARDVHE